MPDPNQPPVVVITGASSGIGRATAHAFAKRGASVVLAALTSAAALPVDMATLPFRMADAGLTATVRFLEAVAPAAKPGPESK